MLVRIVLLYLLTTSFAFAQTVDISLREFDRALDEAAGGGDSVQQYLLERLQDEFQRLDLQWRDGEITRELTIADQELDGGCSYSADLRNFKGRIAIKDNSSIGLSIESLNKPFVLSLQVSAGLAASTDIDQSYGVRVFSNCRKYARDNIAVRLNGTLAFSVTVSMTPTYSVKPAALVLTPVLAVTTRLDEFTYKLDVSDTLLDKQLESRIRKAIDKEFSADKLQAFGDQLKTTLQAELRESWGGDSLLLALPVLEEAQQQKLLALLDVPLFSELGEMLIRDHLPELLYALISGDQSFSTEFFSGMAICELLQGQMLDLQKTPLYTQQSGVCASTDSPRDGQALFADAACQEAVNYRAGTIAEHCEELIDPSRLGNAALSGEKLDAWALSRNARLDVGVRPIDDRQQPYMHRLRYREVETSRGSCQLEMRIFKSDIAAKNLAPLISLHGGSWTSRRDGVLGLEAQVSHFTDQGFIVFEPFYRLTGQDDGNTECNGAQGEALLSDAAAALDWVLANGERFGARPGAVAVTGQSAGAHLAAWLAVHRPADVSKGLLLYPPTDFGHFISQYQSGALSGDVKGLAAVRRFIGKPVDQVSPDDPLVVQNSFPPLIAGNPDAYPPLFIIHGAADSLVPVDQATRLCGAYNGDPASVGVDIPQGAAVQTETCGAEGRLHIIKGAEHMLDVCLFDAWCPAGDELSQQAVRDALTQATRWLGEH
ncbi:MAG: alpha/beta hydrolase [Gammaproteobacteria bacterium]|nr:alpha/beta hydrolase [Gammaproteobacteria bacterium]